MEFFDLIQTNSPFIIFGLLVFSFILFILSIIAICKASKIKKRMNNFMGKNEGSDFEDMLNKFIEQSNKIDARHEKIMSDIADIRQQLCFCIQKMSIIRYNPFEDVGGDLCYAVALLDQNDDGVVINSVYSRDGCYTYAKPIEKGQCFKYKLANEEEEALFEAMKQRPNRRRNEK